VLSYVQGRSADVWKENVMKDLERNLLNCEIVGEFLMDLKKEFGGRGGRQRSKQGSRIEKIRARK